MLYRRMYYNIFYIILLGDLGVMRSPRYRRFAGSSPAEVDGFFQGVKILSTSSGSDFKPGVPSLRFQTL